MKITEPILQPATEADIRNFQEKYNFDLPEDYQQFLLRQNGGLTEYLKFSFAEKAGCGEVFDTKDESHIIHLILAVETGIIESNSRNYIIYEHTDLWTSSRMISIARTPNGDAIVMSLGESDYGWIYLWRHGFSVDETDGTEDCYNIHFIATNFTDFINGLVSLE